MSVIPTVLLTPGEPAGIGPEIAVQSALRCRSARVVLVADRTVVENATLIHGHGVTVRDYDPRNVSAEGVIELVHVPTAVAVVPGTLDTRNAHYVLRTLDVAVSRCVAGDADALVTGPVQKSTINEAGVPFSGHTEYLAEHTGGQPVMMLVAPALRVALVTTHLPLRAVPDAITAQSVDETLRIVLHDLRHRFGIDQPRVQVCGLNPHAGEGGHLGSEDDAVIRPAVQRLAAGGERVDGPWPADTAFVPQRREAYDATLAMYHDQGLSVLKALGFGEAVNVTLGLPIVRTSVDHGTALDLAGKGMASADSMDAALALGAQLANRTTS